MKLLKHVGLLCLCLCLLLSSGALASDAGTVYLIIGDRQITEDTSTSDYTFTFTSTAYPRSGKLVVNDGASLPAVTAGNMSLAIEVKGTTTIESIDTGISGQTFAPQTITINGGGTLNIPSGFISAANGLRIGDGTTVNVTNPNGSAVFVEKNWLALSGGSTLNAKTQNADSDAVSCMDLVGITIDGSTLRASGGTNGVCNYRWATSGVTGTVYVENGGRLEASGSGHSVYNRYWGADDNKTGKLSIDETSSVKLEGSITAVPDLPESYEYKTSAGGSSSLAPYDGEASLGKYLELSGRTVFLPALSRTPDAASMALGDSQTYTVIGSTSVSAPSGTVYEWSVNGTAQSASGSSFTFTGEIPGTHTIQCKVTANIDGVSRFLTLQSEVTVDPIDGSAASVTGMEYYWMDSFTPTVMVDGQTLTPGTDYIMQREIMGNLYEIPHGSELGAAFTPGNLPITFTFMGRYKGSFTQNLTIHQIPLSMTDVTLSFDSVPCNGLDQKPLVVSVSYKDHTFKEGPWLSFDSQNEGDYFLPLDLQQNIEPGSYSIALESRGRYLTGSHSVSYTIAKATPDVEVDLPAFTYGDMFSGPATLQWTAPGNATPLTLTEGTDYTFTAPDGRVGNVGTHTGTLSFMGARYTGTDSFSYQVEPKEITADHISLEEADFVYNGTDQLPAFDVKVRLGSDTADTTLARGTDYTVTFTRDGASATRMTDAGAYTVQVSGQGNYTGSASYTFRVDRLALERTDVSLASDQLPWTGNPCVPTISVQKTLADGAQHTLVSPGDYTVQWLKGSDVSTATAVSEAQLTELGDYFAVITGQGNYQSTVAVPFSIVRANTADGGADTYLEDAAQDTFVFGQTLTVRLTPESDGTVAALSSRLLRSLSAPVSGDDTMTLYLDSVQLTQPAGPDDDGVYAASVSSLHPAITGTITQLPATITLTASFSGNGRLAGRTFDLPVTITPAPLTVSYAQGVNRGYRAGNCTVRFNDVSLSGMLSGYADVQADITEMEGEVASDAIGVYTEAAFDLTAPIALTGAHGGYYHVPALQFNAATDVMIFGPPVIIDPTEPVEKTVYNNAKVLLTVTAEGEELSYQWYAVENGVETALTDGEDYAGTASSSLCILKAKPRSTTQYLCRVTNDAGSDEALFTVTAISLPSTGDNTHPTLWLCLLTLACAGLLILRRRTVKA